MFDMVLKMCLYHVPDLINTAQKSKFSIRDFFSKYDQIRSFVRIWSHLTKETLNGKLHFLSCEICEYTLGFINILSLVVNGLLHKSVYYFGSIA